MVPLKFRCDNRKTRRDGTSLIYLQYCFSSDKRTLLNTGIGIPFKFWNPKKQAIQKDLPPHFEDPEKLNGELKKMRRLAEDLIDIAHDKKVDCPGSFVKNTFSPNLNLDSLLSDKKGLEKFVLKRPAKQDLFQQIDDYIQSKENKVTKATITVFRTMKEHLKAFEIYRKKDITFSCFDYNFYLV